MCLKSYKLKFRFKVSLHNRQSEGPIRKGPGSMAPVSFKQMTAPYGRCPLLASRFFWFVFFAALTKKMNPGVGPGPDGLVLF